MPSNFVMKTLKKISKLQNQIVILNAIGIWMSGCFLAPHKITLIFLMLNHNQEIYTTDLGTHTGITNCLTREVTCNWLTDAAKVYSAFAGSGRPCVPLMPYLIIFGAKFHSSSFGIREVMTSLCKRLHCL